MEWSSSDWFKCQFHGFFLWLNSCYKWCNSYTQGLIVKWFKTLFAIIFSCISFSPDDPADTKYQICTETFECKNIIKTLSFIVFGSSGTLVNFVWKIFCSNPLYRVFSITNCYNCYLSKHLKCIATMAFVEHVWFLRTMFCHI